MNKYIAYYLRISKDDDSIQESNSIASQRNIIKDYIKSSKEFDDMPILEFPDDGYTGTNFNRPSITQLLEMAKKGEIACIIVKDFSRFGRQYLEVSKFIEQIFPSLGIRFISVNDYYDSYNHKGTSPTLDVAFRNMINAIYSKDTSEKIKTAIQTKKQQGILIKSISIFGYKVEENQGRKMVIDEPAAEIVRQIFMLADNGLSSFKIAEKLNKDNIITPAIYKIQNGSKLAFKTSKRGFWTAAMISNIIRDERYTGTFVGCVRESVKFASNKRKRKPKDKWIRKIDTHPAIISKDLFNSVTEKRKKYSITNNKANTDRPLFKKVICGYCGHIMLYKKSKTAVRYICETSRYSDIFGCKKEYIYEQDILDTVNIIINELLKVLLETEQPCYREKNIINKNDSSTKITTSKLEYHIKKLHIAKRLLYESYKKGEVNKQIYSNKRKAIEVEIASHLYSRDISTVENKNQVLPVINNDIVNDLIEFIYFYSKDRIEIKFSFKNKMEYNL